MPFGKSSASLTLRQFSEQYCRSFLKMLKMFLCLERIQSCDKALKILSSEYFSYIYIGILSFFVSLAWLGIHYYILKRCIQYFLCELRLITFFRRICAIIQFKQSPRHKFQPIYLLYTRYPNCCIYYTFFDIIALQWKYNGECLILTIQNIKRYFSIFKEFFNHFLGFHWDFFLIYFRKYR